MTGPNGTPGLFTATPEYVAQCGRQVEGIQGQCTTVSRQAFTDVSPLVNGRWAGAAAMKARQIVLTLESDMNSLLAALGEFSAAIQQTATSVGSQEQNAAAVVGQVGGSLNLDLNQGPVSA
jgi:hypothetical protein